MVSKTGKSSSSSALKQLAPSSSDVRVAARNYLLVVQLVDSFQCVLDRHTLLEVSCSDLNPAWEPDFDGSQWGIGEWHIEVDVVNGCGRGVHFPE
jgi:hypothetical protein